MAANLLNSNIDFETDTTGWTAQNATVTASTDQAKSGSKSMKVVNTGDWGCSQEASIACAASTAYVIGAWVWVSSGNAVDKAILKLKDDVGAVVIGTAIGGDKGYDAWYWVTETGTTDGSATELTAQLFSYYHDNSDTGDTAYFDRPILQQGTVITFPTVAGCIVGL